jgi:hypothetical protein
MEDFYSKIEKMMFGTTAKKFTEIATVIVALWIIAYITIAVVKK